MTKALQHNTFFKSDLLQLLNERGLEIIIHEIFEHLTLEDLQCCQLVNKEWNYLVERLWEHYEYNRVGKGWSEGNPTLRTVQCEKKRSVCTVSGIAIDESAIVVGLGSSGVIQLWSRRNGKCVLVITINTNLFRVSYSDILYYTV